MTDATLHAVTGAGATGKSSVRRALGGSIDASLFEYDTLLDFAGGPPADASAEGAQAAREYNDAWLRLCSQAAHSASPVVLFGSGLLPELVEPCEHRDRFADVRYLSLVCENDELRRRLHARPGWAERSDYWGDADRQVELNEQFRSLAADADSPVTARDTTDESVEETAAAVRAWLKAE